TLAPPTTGSVPAAHPHPHHDGTWLPSSRSPWLGTATTTNAAATPFSQADTGQQASGAASVSISPLMVATHPLPAHAFIQQPTTARASAMPPGQLSHFIIFTSMCC